MRLLLTAVLSFVFVPAFLAFFLLSSIVDFVDRPDRLLESARSSQVRESIIDLTAGFIAEEIKHDPALESMSVEQLRVIVAGVITQTWLDESLVTAHRALKGAIHGAEDTAILDLRGTKSALRAALSNLKGQAKDNCAQLLGARACGDAKVSERMVGAYEGRALAAIAKITDEMDLLRHLQGKERKQAERLREGLESLETVRMLALVLLIMTLALIIALNNRPVRRLLVVSSALALSSSFIYLFTVALSASFAGDAMSTQGGRYGEQEVREFTSKLVGQLLEDSITGSTMPVAMIGVLGAVILLLTLLLGRRRG